MALPQELRFMARNAAKLARKVGTFEGRTTLLQEMAAERTVDAAHTLLMSNLRSAIASHKEYDWGPLRDRLVEVFSNPEMISFSRNGVHIRRNARRIAGGESLLAAGIEGARRDLGLGRLDPGKALEFWTHRIYRPAREGLQIPRRFKKNIRGRTKTVFDYVGYATLKYSTTMEARLSNWGTQAPYWIWLDKGSGGYPGSGGTEFIAKTEAGATNLYRSNLEVVAREFTDALTNEVSAFLRNPQAYEPGQFLGQVEFRGRRFRLSVTPTGELSVRRI
jgi:hypothetical protein